MATSAAARVGAQPEFEFEASQHPAGGLAVSPATSSPSSPDSFKLKFHGSFARASVLVVKAIVHGMPTDRPSFVTVTPT